MRPSLLIVAGHFGALLFLTFVHAANSAPSSIDSNRNKRLFMLNADAFRNRRSDLDIGSNVEVDGQPGFLEQRAVRRSQAADTRRRPCFFSPIQCTLFQQQFSGNAQEGSAVEVFRPVMNPGSSRKRQTARQNALLLQHFNNWRTNEPTNRFRL